MDKTQCQLIGHKKMDHGSDTSKRWTLTVQEHEDGSQFIEFPEEVLKDAGWKEGDTLKWTDRGDGSWSLSKIEES